MIGWLQGRLVEKQPPRLLIDVQGIGYNVFASMTTIFQLPDLGEKIALHTHLLVREDALTLYGFLHPTERHLFCALIKVNGVGAKMALAILSSMPAAQFAQCIAAEDVSMLVKIPGIGKKTAQRLIVEMRDRLSGHLDGMDLIGGVSRPTTPEAREKQDAISALLALGYKQAQAVSAVNAVLKDNTGSEQLIRAALKQLG
jgi:holliday junction DNA helicase RuvA